jgi:hypothetical protein
MLTVFTQRRLRDILWYVSTARKQARFKNEKYGYERGVTYPLRTSPSILYAIFLTTTWAIYHAKLFSFAFVVDCDTVESMGYDGHEDRKYFS